MRGKETGGVVAAFFDLDGTLIPGPSLEKRFFADLRYRGTVPVGNYFLWLARGARLIPRGIQAMRHANKMYLRGVLTDQRSSGGKGGQPEMAVPRFFPAAVEQVAWHAKQGHAIILVSGTLEPLAREMALALMVRLAVRGVEASLVVCATRLEENDGRWTGRIIGDAMYGEAKACAVRRIAAEGDFDLSQCYAYGDCVNDRWMLEAVGRPAVVNPSRGMKALAQRRGWTTLMWAEKRNSTPRAQTMHGRDEAEKVA
jgi:HAD superfamily hydrolase (TIGR01490 family)